MVAPRILLVVGGGIAAYKSCELVRLIKKGGGEVTCVLTEGGAQFVTPMSLAALSGNKVHSSLWDLKDEAARRTSLSCARQPRTCSPRWPPASPTLSAPR